MIDLVAEQSALGGLDRWLHDVTVTEVLVNGGGDVWVERAGRLEQVGVMRAATLLGAIEHILAPIGRRLDRASPTVDARLPDGSRVCAVLPPVAVDGPVLAVRRFATGHLPVDAFGPPEIAALLRHMVATRCNVLVSGATSAGKTTLLGALAAEVPHHERIVVIEDVTELQPAHPHVVRLETRPATPDGVAEVTLAHLLRTALRLRPDRLAVGEVRGSEATQLLQAMNTGHDGSLATVHANSAVDALARVASLVLHDHPAWPLAAIHDDLGRAIDVVVHVHRTAGGGREVDEAIEVGRDGGAHRTIWPAGAEAAGAVAGVPLQRGRR